MPPLVPGQSGARAHGHHPVPGAAPGLVSLIGKDMISGLPLHGSLCLISHTHTYISISSVSISKSNLYMYIERYRHIEI